MLKEHANAFRKLTVLADLALVSSAFFGVYALLDKRYLVYPLSRYLVLFPVFLMTWGVLLSFFGLYRSFRFSQLSLVIFNIFKATLLGFVVFSSVIYLMKWEGISRVFSMAVFAATGALVSIERIGMMLFFWYIRKRGFNFRSVLVVGTGKRAQRIMRLLDLRSKWGLRIVGLVDEDPNKVGQEISGHPVLGTLDDMATLLKTFVVDDAVFVVPRSWLYRIEKAMSLCETQGVKIHVAVDYFQFQFARAKQTDLDGFPLLSFGTVPDSVWHLMLKRIFDVAVSMGALIVLSPAFLVVSMLVKATSRGPVFFRQTRCGLNGRTFTLYKFRTMVRDAEKQLDTLKAYNEMGGPVFKMKDDPRLTRIGRALRKYSLDELPQLWNVLRGDMSLVGPRPPLPGEVSNYELWQRRRLSMRPGITCLWQAGGRNRITDFKEWVQLDLEYIDNWSLWLDCKVLLKTIPAVVFARGAK